MSDWLDAEQRVERAQQLSESQRWAEALEELDLAIGINANNSTWHAQRGYILEELERMDDAAESYERAVALDPGDRDMAMALGVCQLRLGRFARAIEIFDELARLHPDWEPVYCHRVHAYTELAQHDRAEEMFYLAQQINDSCPHCFFSMGMSLLARQQPDRAIYCWQRALDIEPNYVGVHERISDAYREKGDLKNARDHLLRAVRNDPGNTELLFDLADLTLETGRVASALAQFSQIIELDPEHVESHYALGRIWLRLRQPARALPYFETVARLGGEKCDLPGFQMHLGEALYRLNRVLEARAALETAAKNEPGNARVLMLLGDCLLSEDRASEASDWYRRVLARDDRNPFAHHKLGVCLARLANVDAAARECLTALQIKPDYAPALYNASVCLMRLGQWRDAAQILQQAEHQQASNPAFHALRVALWRHRLVGQFRRLSEWVTRTSNSIAGR